MKKLFPVLVVIIAVLVYILLQAPPSSDQRKITGLPWQIDLLADGYSRVFGIELGKHTLGDIKKILDDDVELAIISPDNEKAGLEMYNRNFKAGLLSGKLVVVADMDQAKIIAMRKRGVRKGGENRFRIHPDDFPVVWATKVKSLTFIPLVKLDKEVAILRFGKPGEIIEDKNMTHLLYAKKGLDIILYKKGKDVLQYVAPKDFASLRAPLNK